MSLKNFHRWDDESRRQWAMAWQGSRQNDSPSGRLADERALNAFASLSDAEKSQIDPDLRSSYERALEERKIMQS